MTAKTKWQIGLGAAGAVSLALGGPALLSGVVVAAKVIAPVAAGLTCIAGSYVGTYYAGKYQQKKSSRAKR